MYDSAYCTMETRTQPVLVPPSTLQPVYLPPPSTLQPVYLPPPSTPEYAQDPRPSQPLRRGRAPELTRDEKLVIRTLHDVAGWTYKRIATTLQKTERQVEYACQTPLTPKKNRCGRRPRVSRPQKQWCGTVGDDAECRPTRTAESNLLEERL
ncbi:hypothetical protein VTK73DRAFT_3493 [Phialemonium thermophilum]|uniref:Uncharacterized protein n=1 Tax=Phialemonium thermophilum TaxID=223376 RepID=A0ABR3WZB1_9PEZI